MDTVVMSPVPVTPTSFGYSLLAYLKRIKVDEYAIPPICAFVHVWYGIKFTHKLIYLGKCHGRGISVLVVTKGSRILVVAVHICSVDALESHCVARAAVAEDAGDLRVQIVVVNVDAAAVGVGEGILEEDVVL